MDEDELMVQWFELINAKNDLVRKEADLMYRQRQQELEVLHEELEYELRCLMNKSGAWQGPKQNSPRVNSMMCGEVLGACKLGWDVLRLLRILAYSSCFKNFIEIGCFVVSKSGTTSDGI